MGPPQTHSSARCESAQAEGKYTPASNAGSALDADVEKRRFRPAFRGCTAYNICMQFSIRNVPDTLDEALRRAAREQGKRLNQVAIEALARGAGVTGERRRQRDLGDVAGNMAQRSGFQQRIVRSGYD